jgi:hypothetical protein
VITFALAVVWVYAAVRIHRLPARASRLRVRRDARRARSALLIAILLVPAVGAAIAVPRLEGAGFLAGPADDGAAVGLVLAGPLLILPAVGAVIWSLPRLGRIIRMLYADPRGPNDLPIRDAGADPALAVPVYVAALGALATVLAVPYGAAATGIAYAVILATTVTLWHIAHGRRRRVRRTAPGTGPAGATRDPAASHVPVGASHVPVGASHVPVGASHVPVGAGTGDAGTERAERETVVQ